jgi:hypothetical protein
VAPPTGYAQSPENNMPLFLQFAQTLLVLLLSTGIYVLALPRKDRLHPAIVYWVALAPASVIAGAELFTLMAMGAGLPHELPQIAWMVSPLRALAVVSACGLTGLLGILGLRALVQACVQGEKMFAPRHRSTT